MAQWTDGLQAVVFDYGNTLIPFGGVEAGAVNRAMQAELERRYGPCDAQRFEALRREQILRPYADGNRENDLDETAVELVAALYGGRRPDVETLDVLREVRQRAFHAAVRPGPATVAVLTRLAARFRLALLSNYPCGDTIRESLARLGLDRFFQVVVVSADLGLVKPHPEPYARILAGLGLPAPACVMVGDNWLADVQGGRRSGLRAVLTTEYVSYEGFQPYAGDHPPDARIARLDELPGLLGC